MQHYAIIIVDDEALVIEYIKRLVASRIGISISIDSAGTLAAGMAMCSTRTHPYDLIILDLNLPDAKELYGLEKLLNRFPEIPIIVLTGYYDPDQAEQALEIGAQGYFQKPITNGDELFQLIVDAVSRNRRVQRLRLEMNGLKRDMTALQKENVSLKEEVTQSKITIQLLEERAKGRKVDVDKQLKRLSWSLVGAGFLGAIGAIDKVVELINKLIALF